MRRFTVIGVDGAPELHHATGIPLTYIAARPAIAARKAFYALVRNSGGLESLARLDPSEGPCLGPEVAETLRPRVEERMRRFLPDDAERAHLLANRFVESVALLRSDSLDFRLTLYIREFGSKTTRHYKCGYRLNQSPNLHEIEKGIVKLAHAWHVPLKTHARPKARNPA